MGDSKGCPAPHLQALFRASIPSTRWVLQAAPPPFSTLLPWCGPPPPPACPLHGRLTCRVDAVTSLVPTHFHASVRRPTQLGPCLPAPRSHLSFPPPPTTPNAPFSGNTELFVCRAHA